MKRLSLAVVIAAGIAATPAFSNEFEPALRDLAENKVMALVSDPAILAAIQAQNQKHTGMSVDDIESLGPKMARRNWWRCHTDDRPCFEWRRCGYVAFDARR